MAKKKTSKKKGKRRLRRPQPVAAVSWQAEMTPDYAIHVRIRNIDGSGSPSHATPADLTAADRREYVRIVEILIDKAHERAGYMEAE